MPQKRKYFPTDYICETCKTTFTRLNNRDHRFCSVRCRALAHGVHKEKRICEWCKKEFEVWPSRQGRFCSNQCRSEFASRQHKVVTKPNDFGGKVFWYCKQCGKEMHTFKSRVRDTCSQKCAYLYWPVELWKSDAHHPNWRNGSGLDRGPRWQTQSRMIRKRDNQTCQSCGNRGKLVHHITPYSEFNNDWEKANDPSNLITLCQACHVKIEHKVIPCPPVINQLD